MGDDSTTAFSVRAPPVRVIADRLFYKKEQEVVLNSINEGEAMKLGKPKFAASQTAFETFAQLS